MITSLASWKIPTENSKLENKEPLTHSVPNIQNEIEDSIMHIVD